MTRNGLALELPVPVTTHYRLPCERVLFDARRDANPFFHLMEALWVIAGRRDVEWLTRYNKRMAEFSDDGREFHAAYGYRLRHCDRDNIDQLEIAISLLRANPNTRQVALSIWDPKLDLGMPSKDIPCNDLIMLDTRDGNLNIMVSCRSNDFIWGTYGANVVQFSMLQEYLAGRVEVPVGWYDQVSFNYHAYLTTLELNGPHRNTLEQDPYADEGLGTVPLFSPGIEPRLWDGDLQRFFSRANQFWAFQSQGDIDLWMEDPAPDYFHDWFAFVAEPVMIAWKLHKAGYSGLAHDVLDGCMADDWRRACQSWLQRRIQAKALVP